MEIMNYSYGLLVQHCTTLSFKDRHHKKDNGENPCATLEQDRKQLSEETIQSHILQQ